MKKFDPYGGHDVTQPNRVKATAEFIIATSDMSPNAKSIHILDTGEINSTITGVVDILRNNSLNATVYSTVGDLDFEVTPEYTNSSKWKYVTCFEVIEHLINPGLLFKNIYDITTDDAYLFISYPSRGCLMQTANHFHEYPKEKFQYMLDKTGWEIVVRDRIKLNWAKTFSPEITTFQKLKFFLGIRPILRVLFDHTNILCIRKKGS